MTRKTTPGVSREDRISDEGLERLEKHLAAGVKVSDVVLKQWIRRYGEHARKIIRQHGQYTDELDEINGSL